MPVNVWALEFETKDAPGRSRGRKTQNAGKVKKGIEKVY
jgi:hypothetical protein